jgi:branched-chain amino acid transport system ATP-binding protein
MTAPASVLEVSDLRKSFGAVAAVRGISFTVAAGEVLAMIGANGAGKSTCFAMLGGQLRPDGGRVILLGRDVTGARPATMWRHGVGRTFQVTETFASMTARENVQMALLAQARRIWRFWTPASRHFASQAETVLREVGLGDQAERAAGVLAYGDVKRLDLAMALASRPRLLLMDEPTAGMAPRERIELMRLTAQIAREQSIGVLFTEHDMDVVFEHADRILVLNRGSLIAEGSPEQVRGNPQVRAIYLGEGLVYDARHREGAGA